MLGEVGEVRVGGGDDWLCVMEDVNLLGVKEHVVCTGLRDVVSSHHLSNPILDGKIRKINENDDDDEFECKGCVAMQVAEQSTHYIILPFIIKKQ